MATPGRCPISRLAGCPPRTLTSTAGPARTRTSCLGERAATPRYCGWASPRNRSSASGRPPRPQRKPPVVAVLVDPDSQNLVQLNDVRFEPEPRARHVEAPHLGGGQADLLDGFVPVVDEVAAPVTQGQGV